MDRRLIQASSPSFKGNEKKYVLDCLDRGWITQGKYVKRFEEEFADYCGTKHAIACSSGTAALHLALLSLGVRPGDVVIVPALTYIATANAVSYCGVSPKFCDVMEDDWCMSPDSFADIEGIYGQDNRVLAVPVHLYDAECSGIYALDNLIVCDASHHYWYNKVEEISTYSFYGSKIVACGEGGMLITNKDDINSAARLYRGQGATIPGRYHHSVVGYNYRMTDLQAAVGLAQLERIEESLSIRREIVNRYRSNLSNSPITLQGGQRASGWTCAVLVPKEYDRDKIMGLLLEDGIETRPFFEPIPSLPPYQNCGPVPPVAAEISKRGICLPTHTEMSIQDVDYVSSRLLEAVA